MNTIVVTPDNFLTIVPPVITHLSGSIEHERAIPSVVLNELAGAVRSADKRVIALERNGEYIGGLYGRMTSEPHTGVRIGVKQWVTILPGPWQALGYLRLMSAFEKWVTENGGRAIVYTVGGYLPEKKTTAKALDSLGFKPFATMYRKEL